MLMESGGPDIWTECGLVTSKSLKLIPTLTNHLFHPSTWADGSEILEVLLDLQPMSEVDEED